MTENDITDRLDRIITLLEWHQSRLLEADADAQRRAAEERRAKRRAGRNTSSIVFAPGSFQIQSDPPTEPTDADRVAV